MTAALVALALTGAALVLLGLVAGLSRWRAYRHARRRVEATRAAREALDALGLLEATERARREALDEEARAEPVEWERHPFE